MGQPGVLGSAPHTLLFPALLWPAPFSSHNPQTPQSLSPADHRKPAVGITPPLVSLRWRGEKVCPALVCYTSFDNKAYVAL